MRLVLWNVAGRVSRWHERMAAIEGLSTDVHALQRWRPRASVSYRRDLPSRGLEHLVESFELARQPQLLVYVRTTDLWSLSRMRADLKWRAYRPALPSADLSGLVEVVDEDNYNAFLGKRLDVQLRGPTIHRPPGGCHADL